jgi:hypothetical protein
MRIITQSSLDADSPALARFAQEFAEPATYMYHINLDERGTFYADVRNSSGKTVFEIKIDDSTDPNYDHGDGGNIFTDGFMKHKHDMDGLRQYLIHLGVMSPKTRLVDAELRRAASGARHRRLSRMVVCRGPSLIGGIQDAHRAIFKDGFDPRDMVVASYDPEAVMEEPAFPANSRIALTAHAARCKLTLAALSEDGPALSPAEFVAVELGGGVPQRGWAKFMDYANRNERRMP